jgi:hypothetical protein
VKHLRQSGISSIGGSIADREHLAAYLLGELPPEEQLRLEQEYFADDAAYEQLLAVEDELAYDCLQGRLSPERRARFETTIGATERGRRNLEFARALLEVLRSTRAAAPSPARYWVAGLAAAVITGVIPVWLAFRVASLTQESETLHATQARLEQRIAALRSVPAVAPLETAFLLAPGQARGGDGPARLQLSAEAGSVRFELVLPPGAASGDYVVSIRTSVGSEVWSGSATVAGRTLAVSLPAKLLGAGAYEVSLRRLTAGEQPSELATYSFRLTRK